MDNSDSLRNQIYNNMQLKTTEELEFILEQDDHEEWTDTAFEVVKKILIQRTGRLPDLPATTMYSLGKPTDWETVNWQAISDKCDKMLIGAGLKTRILVFVFLLLPLGLIIFFSTASGSNKLVTFSFAFLLWVVLLGINVWLYLRTQNAKRIVAKARVYLKDARGRNRGTVYDVGFAIKSAFTLRKDGGLVMNKSWNGHHTLSVPVQHYNRLNEQEIVNLIFLSNNWFLGLLEDFEEK